MSNKQRIDPLPPGKLYTRCEPASLGFETTADLPATDVMIGQERALTAIDFGVRIPDQGYNLFVLGKSGSRRHNIVETFLQQISDRDQREALDWCYINNFDDERRPIALSLPAGRGAALRRDAAQLIEDLQGAIPAIFESEQHESGIAEINQEFEEKVRASLSTLHEEAQKHDLSLVQTPHGFAIAPTADGKLISDEQFEQLPEEEKERRAAAMEAMSEEMRKHIEELPRWQKERRDRIKALHRDLVGLTVDQLIAPIKGRYAEFGKLVDYFDRLREDVIGNTKLFQPDEESVPGAGMAYGEASLRRYQINLLVDRSEDAHPPIIYENNPSVAKLFGTIEHLAQFGALITNFTMIVPGALHKANGGYLIIDAERVLMEPFAWSALKRALAAREIRIESIGQLMNVVSTVSLEPDPIPADLKVILIGERRLYYLLTEYDAEFSELFKVAADFEDRVDRSGERIREYAQMLGNLARSHDLLPLTNRAVARTIEHGARLLGDSEKLTTRIRDVTDVVREANFRARQDGAPHIDAEHIEGAIDAQIARLDRIRGEMHEAIARDTVLIDTSGERIAQVNGLSVLELGGFRFGQPSRITASARVGDGTIVDIERETELGGPIHSKGVLILSAYLRGKYAAEMPLSVSASLVFEQSYGGVEGDSASIAETCALLSAIGEIPIRQSLAVTGSLNQHGHAQVIGGVNEKIEGFFDVCASRGLTGDQGVIIPADNVKHLMLRRDVVAAVEKGEFNVYPIASIDEAIELLTGVAAGERDDHGRYPVASVNGIVEKRLKKLTKLRQSFDRAASRKTTGRRKGQKSRSSDATP